MSQAGKKDGEPWTPKVEGGKPFTTSADFERGLGEDGKTPDIDVVDEATEDEEEQITSDDPNPFIRPRK
jgi:hypothetical protein